MKKVGIVIEDWKLPAFKRVLGENGIIFDKHKGPTEDCYTLTVFTDHVKHLYGVIRAASDAARDSKRKNTVH